MNRILLAFDHAVEHGPRDYRNVDISLERIERIAKAIGGIICHVGIARRIRAKEKVVKISARHALMEERQVLVTTVKEAAEAGDAVAVTVYFGTRWDGEMLEMLRNVKTEAREYGMPVMVFAYPRAKAKTKENALYATRMVQELGADAIKTYFMGMDSAKQILSHSFVPVYFAGGQKAGKQEFLKRAKKIIEMGGNLAVGRNVWQREDALEIAKQLRGLL